MKTSTICNVCEKDEYVEWFCDEYDSILSIHSVDEVRWFANPGDRYSDLKKEKYRESKFDKRRQMEIVCFLLPVGCL